MRLFWSITLLWLFTGSWSGMSPRPILGSHAEFAATRVAIRAHSADLRVGGLTFLAGYRLTSKDPAFGGFSSIDVNATRFTLLSDSGNIVRFSLDARGQVANREFGDLPGGYGSGWLKEDRDSESMTRDPTTGRVWVGFEGSNSIWRFAPRLAHAEGQIAPRAMQDWPENGGPEAIVRLRSGKFLVFSEQQPGAHGLGRQALLFDGDPVDRRSKAVGFTYIPPIGYEPTDAAELPDGRIALLNRRFTLGGSFTVVLASIDPHAIRAKAIVRSHDIARFEGDVLHDNYEGLAVLREGNDTILWIVSDDNQSMLQQSLLLKFRLDAAPAAASAPGR